MSWIATTSAGLAAVLLVAVARLRPFFAGLAGGLLCGPLVYFFLGLWLARQRGVGQFFSVPFGGESLRDTAMLLSAGVWILATGLLIGSGVWLWRRRRVMTASRR